MAKKQSKKARKPEPKAQSKRGLSGPDLAAECDITRQRVGQLESEGVFKRNAVGRFDRRTNVVAYIRRIRDETRHTGQSPEAKRLAEAKARAFELRNGQAEGKLIEACDCHDVVTEIFGAWAAELIGVPAAASRDPAVRADIERALEFANGRAREKVLKLGEDIAAGRGVVFEDDDE